MDDRTVFFHDRNLWTLALLALFLLAGYVPPAAAADTPTLYGVIPAAKDFDNLALANRPVGYYYFKFDGGGLNALHIASTSTIAQNYGDVSTTTSQSGTFYITETGGRGYQDDAILMVAVKGEVPDNIAIHIKSSGYTWTPTGILGQQPDLPNITYVTGATDATFTKSQFVYGPQTWKPAGNNLPLAYPIYYGQDTSDTTNAFKIMFIDLNAGPLGANGVGLNGQAGIDNSQLTDYGAVKVEYSIENLDTAAVFNVYAWNLNTNQGKGISWTNGVTSAVSTPSGISGYTVLSPAYQDHASEFPTWGGSTPVFHPPSPDFTVNVTSGTAPLAVQFIDTTPKTVRKWSWDFGDGSTSTEQDPVHVYTAAGTYTVALTVANGQKITATKTQTNLITVQASPGGPGGIEGYSPTGLWTGGWTNGTNASAAAARTVSFTANTTAGLPPLAVEFDDTSGIPDSAKWSWDFTGDGLPESSEKNPVYIFRHIGNYSVNLVVTTPDGRTYRGSRADYIRVSDLPSLNSDEGWISSDKPDAGKGSLAPAQTPEEVLATSTFTFSGISTGMNGGSQDVTIDTARTTAATNGNVIRLTGVGSSWDHLALTLADPPEASGTTLTGTVRSVQAVTAPVRVPDASLGSPGVTLTLNLARLPDPGASITSAAASGPGSAGQNVFGLAAANSGNNLSAIAYTVTFAKTGIANAANGGIIQDAVISMAVSPAWVTSHGGTGKIAILHRADDGTTTVLPTKYLGTDGNGNDLFSAVSPTGLSTFALASVSPAAGSKGAGAGGSSPLGTRIAETLLDAVIVVGVIGGGFLLWRRM